MMAVLANRLLSQEGTRDWVAAVKTRHDGPSRATVESRRGVERVFGSLTQASNSFSKQDDCAATIEKSSCSVAEKCRRPALAEEMRSSLGGQSASWRLDITIHLTRPSPPSRTSQPHLITSASNAACYRFRPHPDARRLLFSLLAL